MKRDGAVLVMVLRIFVRAIQTPQTHCPGTTLEDSPTLHIDAVAFIHRFGSSLTEHVHFHVCVVDEVFEYAARALGADNRLQSSIPSVFHSASNIGADTVAHVHATLRRRILRGIVGRGFLKSFKVKEMRGYAHSGFFVDARVCIESADRARPERLVRCCVRPPFAIDRLRKAGGEPVYRCGKQQGELNARTTQTPGPIPLGGADCAHL